MNEPGGINQTGEGVLFANTGTVGGDVTVVSASDPFRLEQFPCEAPLDPMGDEDASLSVLLRSASRIVPFVGRVAELSQLSSWRDATSRLSVLLVSGPGGQGKTRLAARFADDCAAAGWAVAQARHQSDPQPALPTLDDNGTYRPGVLVVVDYAERWPRLDLERLLRHRLLRRFDRVRVLLLARPAGYWWKALANPLTKLGAAAEQLPLGPLAHTVAQRKVAFTVARSRFAEILGVRGVARLQPAGSLADSGYGLALTLHMAALVAVDARRRHAAMPEDPSALSDYLVRREYDHWQTLADNGRISVAPRTIARLVALATLTRSVPLAEAANLLLLVGLAGNRADAQSLLDDHMSCYPADDSQRFLSPLLPDRLGEDFLADLMPAPMRGPGCGDAWMAQILTHLLPPGEAGLPVHGPAVLSVLIETGRRWQHVRDHYLVPLLLDRPQLAMEAGGASLVTLADFADLNVLTALDFVLPKQRHVELDSGIAALTRRITDHALAQTTDEATRARLNDELAGRLSHAGLFDEAVSANEDAVTLRRRLARGDPAVQEPALANSLGNLSIDLWNVGRQENALDAMTEAVDIYRRRASAEPEAYEEDLGVELNNLAGALIGVDRYADALVPAEEATAILRRLARTDQGLCYELASVLRNLAVVLDRLGRPEEALAAIEETVDTYRRLVLDRAETYEVDLAESLRSLGSRLSSLGRYAEALHATEESAAISRRLAVANPDAHGRGLALALYDLANRRWRVGQREQSLTVNEEAVELWRRLAEDNPRAYERGLAMSLNNLAGRLLDFSRPEEALEIVEEGLGIWRRLAAASSGRFDRQVERAEQNRCRALAALGQPAPD